VHRPWRSYLDLIGGRGFTFEGFSPYRFRDNQVGYLVFRRTH
jgi:hypothetical protein